MIYFPEHPFLFPVKRSEIMLAMRIVVRREVVKGAYCHENGQRIIPFAYTGCHQAVASAAELIIEIGYGWLMALLTQGAPFLLGLIEAMGLPPPRSGEPALV